MVLVGVHLQSLGLSSSQRVRQSHCISFAGPVHHPSGLMPSRSSPHLEACLLITTRRTHRRTKSKSEWPLHPEREPPVSAEWALWVGRAWQSLDLTHVLIPKRGLSSGGFSAGGEESKRTVDGVPALAEPKGRLG